MNSKSRGNKSLFFVCSKLVSFLIMDHRFVLFLKCISNFSLEPSQLFAIVKNLNDILRSWNIFFLIRKERQSSFLVENVLFRECPLHRSHCIVDSGRTKLKLTESRTEKLVNASAVMKHDYKQLLWAMGVFHMFSTFRSILLTFSQRIEYHHENRLRAKKVGVAKADSLLFANLWFLPLRTNLS